ncbi:hypothetical protein GCM10010413_56320 [Promicromonospora sukumoe]
MVVGARKLFTSALGLVLAGTLLGGPPASAASPDDAASGSVGPQMLYTYYDVALAPNAAPAGTAVQLHGYVGDASSRQPFVEATVDVYFNPKGTAPRRAVDRVVTDEDGWFQRTYRPSTSGTYDIIAQESGEPRGTKMATFTARSTNETVRSGGISATKNGFTAKMRVTTQDVVTGVEPQTVYLDAGILSPGGNTSFDPRPYLVTRRAEGQYSAGEFLTPGWGRWSTRYSAVQTYRMSAVHPAGLYDVYYNYKIGHYDDYWDRDGSGTLRNLYVKMPHKPITTIRVRRASTTTISASSTSFTGSRNIELKGSVRKVQLISAAKAANRWAPNTAVKLYFDPAGSAGPVYKKTVRTNSSGVYRTTAKTSKSGKWIAKYVGSSLQAPSERSVTITVR